MPLSVAVIAVAYLLGSVSSAVIVCRLMNLPDPRLHGSKNPGATNVMRIGGKKAAAIVLVGDWLKGLLPVLLAQLLGVDAWIVATTALAAFLGHLYPIFFGFAGGKGVATAFGAMLGMAPLAAAAALTVWLIVALVFRMSSAAALVAAAVSPLLVWWFAQTAIFVATSGVITLFLVWRHRSNIQRLLAGGESKIS